MVGARAPVHELRGMAHVLRQPDTPAKNAQIFVGDDRLLALRQQPFSRQQLTRRNIMMPNSTVAF